MADGIAPEELARAKKTLVSRNIRMFNSVERMGNAFIRQIFAGYHPMKMKEVLADLTQEEVSARLREHFATDNCVLSVVNPVSEVS